MSAMKRWMLALAMLLATGFGVFILPFFFPPPYLAGISVANVAGFNNKVAAVVAAALSVFVFFVSLKWPWIVSGEKAQGDYGRLSRRLVLLTTSLCGGLLAFLSYLIYNSHQRYLGDAGYFIEQLSKHTDYGRKLYTEIEFPYGPLTFYAPVFVRALLFPLHLSLSAAYYIALIVEYFVGLFLFAYVINSLPMRRCWKTLSFLLCAMATMHISLGLNYSPFRFIVPAAFLVVAARHRNVWTAVTWFFAGEITCLAISPEIGFAFGAGSVAFGGYQTFVAARSWLVSVAAPFVATAVFLLLAGPGYLLMLKLFAAGVFSFVVEPLPHIITFLIALVWLVPAGLALTLRQKRPEAPMLIALYVLVLALVPVSFGRADPLHTLFNGFVLYLLSMVIISFWRRSREVIWAFCVTAVFLFTTCVDTIGYESVWLEAIPYAVFHHHARHLLQGALTLVRTGSISAAKQKMIWTDEDHSFDIKALQAIVGDAPVAVPLEVPFYVEEALKRSGQYRPSFYSFLVGVYDASAEARDVRDLNVSSWALLPENTSVHMTQTPDDTRASMGIQITYPAKHEPYVVGNIFNDNLLKQWEFVSRVGIYKVYRRR